MSKVDSTGQVHRFLVFNTVPFLFLCIGSTLTSQEILRGEIAVNMEPIYGFTVDPDYPLDIDHASRRALEEASYLFSAIIYGWAFDYTVGENDRGIAESLELTPVGTISWGDPNLKVTETRVQHMHLYIWADYRLSPDQIRRLNLMKESKVRLIQTTGHTGLEGISWINIRQNALHDAARQAIRKSLEGSVWNKPRGVQGYINLEQFPRYWIDSGIWSVYARFRLRFTVTEPFSVY
ncbi:MAG: hypothetical protein LBQ77_06095 [Treponema sp.]|nr:hypothetical protein [Treponema sp.]